MQHRFGNPHPAGGHMMQYQQQQQPMMNQQLGGIIQLQNGMVMLPNGNVVTPQQAQVLLSGNINPMMFNNMNMNMMQMNNGMMGMQGNMMPMNTGRFGNQSQAISGHITSTNNGEVDMMSDYRFQSTNTNTGTTVEKQIQNKEDPATFNIEVSKGFKFEGNTKVVLQSYYEELKPNQVFDYEEQLTLTDCFEEAIESAIDLAYEKDVNKLVSFGKYLVENSFYKCIEQSKFNELILNNDIKTIYKAIKAEWSTLTNKYDINLFNSFDNIITSAINDFIGINSPVSVNIDSFMTDFNDLLKFLRNLEDSEEDLEDELIKYLNSFIEEIKNNINDIQQIEQQEGKKVTYIPEFFIIAFVDKYSYELGVVNAPSELTMIEDNIINKFLLTTGKFIMDAKKINTCYLVTIDKIVIQLSRNLNDQLFIKKI